MLLNGVSDGRTARHLVAVKAGASQPGQAEAAVVVAARPTPRHHILRRHTSPSSSSILFPHQKEKEKQRSRGEGHCFLKGSSFLSSILLALLASSCPEVAALGRQDRGSWAHILYKMRSGVRRLVMSTHSLPTTQKQPLPSSAVHAASVQCKPAAFAYAPRQSFHHNGHALAH
ncbi:hypothetical protein U9M48_022198 [Paspalum notatum var. saurae]|uniref:Uncharacterized protein n=1 Tax=Paspalum notatum var. saurae TaxID=547442 RepID=A0AAQ3TI68_PASNO